VRPLLLPPAPGLGPEDALAPFDGLLLAGGGDLDPARYGGGEHHPAVYGVDPMRDEMELGLAAAAMALGLPTLAICRGMDLHGHPTRQTSVLHDVKVAAGTRLAAACGREVLRCTSHHHQGVDRLAEGLAAVAWSGDGLVEAVEAGETPAAHRERWVVGVQWHPEMTAAEDPDQQALFAGFAHVVRGH